MNFGSLTISWEELGIAFGIIVIFHVFRSIFTKYIFKLIIGLSKKAPTDLVTNVFLAYERPIRVFFTFIGFYVAYNYLPLPDRFDYQVVLIMRSFMIILIAWGLYNLSAVNSSVFLKIGERLKVDVNDILLPFVSKLVRFVLIAMSLSIIASEWGFDVNGFVAGLGLGGLAFALAAQDSISNFFGGVVIITEKPFSSGDWISTPSVEGTVETISFRSTRVRTFADTIVTVPNATLANEPIQNWSQMGKRRVSFNLGVLYSTPKEQMERCVKRIDDMLRSHDEVHQDLIMVRFNEFNKSSLDIFLYYFTVTTQWVKYLEVKENINLKIMTILDEEGVTIAYPTRSIFLEKSPSESIDVMGQEVSTEIQMEEKSE